MSGGGAGQFEPLELPQGTYKKLQIILAFSHLQRHCFVVKAW